MATELGNPSLERDSGPRRGFVEENRNRPRSGEWTQPVRLGFERVGEIEDRELLGSAELVV